MNSNFWSKLSISKEASPEGIISKEPPINLKTDDSMKVFTNTDYSVVDMKFVLNHSASISGNSHILDNKLYQHNVNIKIVNSENHTELYGFILSLPHSILLKKYDNVNEIINTGVTTDLCVHKDYRSKNLAAHLILGVIHYGFTNNIYTGYHYIKECKSESSLKISNYYRPLNLKASLAAGFEIPSFRIKDYILRSLDSDEQLLKMEYEYKINSSYNSKYNTTDSVFEDLKYLQNNDRKLSVALDEERFNFMKANGFKFKTVTKDLNHKSFIVGLFIYKNRVLYIGSSKKSLNTASMALIEVSQNNTYEIVQTIFDYLSKDGYAVMTGSLFGNLNDNTLRKQLSMVICGYQYLDFYNLHVVHNNNVSNINLLYF
jgi:hypothetical protein